MVVSCIEKSAQHAASYDPFHDILLNRGSTTAYQAIAYEYAIEMTHPLPEGTAVGLLNFVGMVSSRSQMTLHHIMCHGLYHRFVLVITSFASPTPSSKYVQVIQISPFEPMNINRVGRPMAGERGSFS